jgi:hypothetical protein
MTHRLVSQGFSSFFEHPPDRLVRDALRHLELDQPVGQQPERPAGLPGRRLGAGQRYQAGLLLTIQLPPILAPGCTTVECGLQALLDVLPADPRHGRLAHLHRLDNRGVHPAGSAGASVRLEQNPGVR